MRQLFPTTVDPVNPNDVYRDVPKANGRSGVRLNMIASVDGATSVDGVSGALGGGADHRVFFALRSVADVVLVAAGTMRAEDYGPAELPPGRLPYVQPRMADAVLHRRDRSAARRDGRECTGQSPRPSD